MGFHKAMMIDAQVRITGKTFEKLKNVVFLRYPGKEWASFFQFGYRQSERGLILTIVELIEPLSGDLNERVSNVQFMSQYSVRAALQVERGPLCIGVVHSHPRGYMPTPSRIDDDMDGYYGDYFRNFTKEPCYCSIVLALNESGDLVFSGRGDIAGSQFSVTNIIVVDDGRIQKYGTLPARKGALVTERLEELYGQDAHDRLQNTKVTIVGCGGTGSAVAHILARAGIGSFVLVDHDRFEDSNLERLHGSTFEHVEQRPKLPKVAIIQDLIKSINPDAVVVPIVGNILQSLPRDYAVASDLLFSCSDTEHSRVGVSELAYRYLVPVVDVGVQLHGDGKRVLAETGQFTRYSASLPCVYCRHLIDAWRLSVELMSEEEKRERRRAAEAAIARGEDAAGYWRDVPALHTVGHLTTLAAALATTYGIGWLTGKFLPPANFFQFNLLEDGLGYVPVEMDKNSQCSCATKIGYADQGSAYSLISPPDHWPPAQRI